MVQVVAGRHEPLRLIGLLAACSCTGGDSTADTGAPVVTDTAAVTDTGSDSAPQDTCWGEEVIERTAWGDDADGDGHLSLAAGGDDCDDRRPSTYPGAPERCDPWDHDCDGEPLAPGVCARVVTKEEAASWWYREAVNAFGYPDRLQGAAILPASQGADRGLLAVGCSYCSALFEGISPPDLTWVGGGAVLVEPGNAPLGSWIGEEAIALFQADGFAGNVGPMYLGDVDGDNRADLGFVQIDWGAASALALHAGPNRDRECFVEGMAGDADTVFFGPWSREPMGEGRLGDLDLDGDGLMDTLLGTVADYDPYYDEPHYLYVIPGREGGWPTDRLVTDEVMIDINEHSCGGAVAGYRSVGDLDGDGLPEVAFPCTDSSGPTTLIVPGPDLIQGDGAALEDLAKWEFPIYDRTVPDEELWQVANEPAGVGDRTGDGLDEVALATGEGPPETIQLDLRVVSPSPDGGVIDGRAGLTETWHLLPWVDEDGTDWDGGWRRYALTAADFNGDGVTDLVLWMPRYDWIRGLYRYQLHVLDGNARPENGGQHIYSYKKLWTIEVYEGDGTGLTTYAGPSVGDLDNDGYDDLAFLAVERAENSGEWDTHHIFVIPGWDIPWDEDEYWE